MASKTAQIDTTIEIITPENIAFTYRLAGPFRRLPAYVMDWLIRAALLFVVAIVALMSSIAIGALGFAVWLFLYFVLSWFYGGLFEAFWNGQTPGKRVMGLRVLSTSGRPINGYQAIMRNLLRSVDVSVFLPLALTVMACNSRFQRFGDLISGTMVVVEEQPWLGGVAKIEDPRAYQLASYLPADLRVSRSMARALAHYAERRRYFSAPRRREVAAHVAEPLLRQYHLPANTSCDLLLCAMYYRSFIADRGADETHAAEAEAALGGTSRSHANLLPSNSLPGTEQTASK